jgi:hypothetical protein
VVHLPIPQTVTCPCVSCGLEPSRACCRLVQAAWRGQLSRRHICGVLVVHVTGGAGLPVPLLRKINPYVALEVLDGHRKVRMLCPSQAYHMLCT